jgi:hypothetical protein
LSHHRSAASVVSRVGRRPGSCLYVAAQAGDGQGALGPGFGNARTVRTFFDRVRDRQAERIKQEKAKALNQDIFILKREDLLFNRLDESFLKKSDAYQELQKMEELKQV